MIFNKLKQYEELNQGIIIIKWHHHQFDDDMIELGQEFANNSGLNFVFMPRELLYLDFSPNFLFLKTFFFHNLL